MPSIMDLPMELKGLVLKALSRIGRVSSLALVWRETWHDIRTARFQYIDLDDYKSRSVRLPRLLGIIKTAPEVALYIKEIDVGEGGDWTLNGVPCHWSEEEGILENLASLINVARCADELWLRRMSPSIPLECPQYSVLKAAFQASSIRHLHLYQYIFTSPAKLLEFIDWFPLAESIDMYDGRVESQEGLDESQRVQSLSQHAQITSMALTYASDADVRFLQLIADQPLFPDVQSFAMSCYDFNFIPTLRRLLVQWSATLTSLELPFLIPRYVPIGVAPLQLPPTLTTLDVSVRLVKGQQSCIEFITSTLLQNQAIGKLMLVVRYSYQCAHLMTPEEIDAIARLDTAVVERVEFLEWEGILARPCTCTSRDVPTCVFQDVCRTADEWMFKQALPKVTEKFFAGMPIPEPGDFHRGPFATREHWSYDSN
ncbi:hypothetical protein CYLTODRAFT_491158, partial [Cylindrobasidium torrendii FP15055 ss-10]